MKQFKFFILIIFLSSGLLMAENEEDGITRFTVSGHVKDDANGEELIGATVLIKELQKGTVTNYYGFYSISLPPDEYTLVFSYLGFAPIEKTIDLSKDISMEVSLSAADETLDEVVVRGQKANHNVTSTEMSVVKMKMQTIKQIPALMGEVDVIKAIMLLPGVQSTAEGSSGFSVRGGSPDQNLILLDEATVYNASHLMGLFSVFNNDAIKDIKLYKGDIPASSGGRLSSLLDVRMKDGNQKKISGSGGIGTISSRLTLEGPIIKDKTSFIIAGRRTYADLFLPFAKDEDLKKSKLYFYDLNAKVNHKIDDNNRIYLSAYSGRDVFKNPYAEMGFGNSTITTRWNHLFSKKLFSNFSLIYSQYDYLLGTPEGEANSFRWESHMQDYSAKADFGYYINTDNTLKFGLIATHHTFDPGTAKGLGEESFFTEYAVPENFALETGTYISNEQKIGSRLTLKYGVRLSGFSNIGEATIYDFDKDYEKVDSTIYEKNDFFNSYWGLEPRFGANILIDEQSSVKTSYSRTRQYVHLAQNSTAGTPLDIWFPSSPNVKPQISDQIALGYFRNFRNNMIEGSVEAYYKKMDNVIDFKDHATLLLNKELEGELRFGEAYSYGLEFLLRLNDPKLNGWISYTYSRTKRKIDEINNGNEYFAPYDKTHDVSIVLNYNISKRVTVSANWIYSTGSPVTFPTGRFEYQNLVAPVYSDRNSYRMPHYDRLDIGVTIRNKEVEGRRWHGEWNFSFYNAYMKKNAWAINFIQDEMNPNKTYAEMTYLFSIIPSITYNFHF